MQIFFQSFLDFKENSDSSNVSFNLFMISKEILILRMFDSQCHEEGTSKVRDSSRGKATPNCKFLLFCYQYGNFHLLLDIYQATLAWYISSFILLLENQTQNFDSNSVKNEKCTNF